MVPQIRCTRGSSSRRYGFGHVRHGAVRADSGHDRRQLHGSRDLLARIRRRPRFRRLSRDLARYRATLGDQWFYDRTGHGADPWCQLPACDVVHLHSMARFVDYGQFFAHTAASTVVVRTLHDMSFVTGAVTTPVRAPDTPNNVDDARYWVPARTMICLGNLAPEECRVRKTSSEPFAHRRPESLDRASCTAEPASVECSGDGHTAWHRHRHLLRP